VIFDKRSLHISSHSTINTAVYYTQDNTEQID